MSYGLRALIGKRAGLQRHAGRCEQARLVPLEQGFALVPVTDELWDEIAAGRPVDRPDPYPEFDFLSASLEAWAIELSAGTSVAYVEVDLWAGSGTKAAIAWREGAVILGPMKSVQGLKRSSEDGARDAAALRLNPINRALRAVGVHRGVLLDEFDALGLGRHRRTPAWGEHGRVEDAGP